MNGGVAVPSGSLEARNRQSKSPTLKRSIVSGCAGFALLTAVYPVIRTLYRVEVDYNEGWNIYNAERVVNHQPLYPVAYGWETVNYPMLWFAMMAWLHRFTHEYLFTARAVSLLALVGCCALAGLIVKRLSDSPVAGLLTSFLCLAVFCTNADMYIGMDDPQLLAHFFFLLGFFIYLRRRQSLAHIALAAAIFVFAGNIKHNAVDFPLAVLIDLAIVSWRRAFWFVACGFALAVVSVGLNTHFGGPYFVTEMLAPRFYAAWKVRDAVVSNLGPMLIPTIFALALAFAFLRDPRRRSLALLGFTSLAVGSAFGGGIGVSVNTFFSFFFASVMLLGVAFADLDRGRWRWASKRLFRVPLRSYAAPILFLWMAIPAMVAKIANPIHMLEETAAGQQRFDREVALLRAQAAPTMCESLLRCFLADKPYVYDPFNATRLIELHKLDPQPLIDGLHKGQYAAVQMNQTNDPATEKERFPAPLVAAVHEDYRPALVDEDVVIYVPKARNPQTLATASAPAFAPAK